MSASSGVTIEAMQWFDLAGVAALEAAIYPDGAWSEATWWAELAGRPRRHYVVATATEPGRVITGYAGININGENADVMTIAVAPQHQGNGLGSVLLTRLHQEANARGAGAMLLEVRADNRAALVLYGRHGYERIATRANYYDVSTGGGVDALVMRRALGPKGAPDA